jgi:hypothetical protein
LIACSMGTGEGTGPPLCFVTSFLISRQDFRDYSPGRLSLALCCLADDVNAGGRAEAGSCDRCRSHCLRPIRTVASRRSVQRYSVCHILLSASPGHRGRCGHVRPDSSADLGRESNRTGLLGSPRVAARIHEIGTIGPFNSREGIAMYGIGNGEGWRERPTLRKTCVASGDNSGPVASIVIADSNKHAHPRLDPARTAWTHGSSSRNRRNRFDYFYLAAG